MQQLLIETVVMPEFSTGRHTPNSYQDHKSESSTLYPHLASRAAGFFKAHYHQEPDPTNSLLNICGYGGLVRFKKENPALWLGFVKWVARDCANSLLPDLPTP
ncbi:TPA: hypothetical protein NBJ98_002652 [Citrobacter freundii]|nr:hypothetical protein [Citrobacter freundii]